MVFCPFWSGTPYEMLVLPRVHDAHLHHARPPDVGAVGRAVRGTPVEPGRHVDVRTDLAGLEVAAADPFPYQVDGDFLGDTRRLAFRHEPDALDLLIP